MNINKLKMKILITENQLEKIIFKYITKELEKYEVIDGDKTIRWTFNDNSGDFNYVMRYYKDIKSLYIDPELRKSVENIFGISESEVYTYFIKWCQNYRKMKINNIYN